ncbi:hypothetical protein [Aquimonas voraii]|uniref:DUF2845 domain-containing protein n=1 Tax=Aquimonas voraii TaxID=265719 RepID=A0A1G6S0A0_9GAMM|nr:hypothetical protein [Aquimonas voraii]SDD09635.1 hypothetical protein SAMN04488509_101182 [Aquimonas voraii]
MNRLSRPIFLLGLLALISTASAMDLQRCNGRVLKLGDWASEAPRLCGAPFHVDRWQEIAYVDLDAHRSLRQRIEWNEAYFDLGEGSLLFRVRSRQGRIVAIDTLERRGGPAQPGDCSLAALKRSQSVGEVVHRCGLPAQRIDLGVALVDQRGHGEEAKDLRHQQWLYSAGGNETLVIELHEGRLVRAGLR